MPPRALPPGNTFTTATPFVVYPSPKLDDRILVEEHDHKNARIFDTYTPDTLPAYGTEHPSRTGFRLTQITPADEGRPGWFKWIWANDRTLQQEYNAEISYPYGDVSYPRYERTFITRRSQYVATAAAADDPVDSSLKLVAQQMGRMQDKTLDALFVVETRVYEKIPGPQITSTRVNNRGDLETVVTQTVSASTTADVETLLQTESEVKSKDTILGEKTTATVASHSTFTSREFDRSRAHGAEITQTEEIVDPATATLPTLNTTVLDAQIVQISKKKAKKVVRTIASGGQPIVSGTHVDEATGICVDYTKQFVAAGTLGSVSGQTFSEVQPVDKWLSLQIVSTLRLSSLPADKQYPITMRDSFPDVLRDVVLANTGLSAVGYNKIEGYSGPLIGRVTEKYMTDQEFENWEHSDVGTKHKRRPVLTQFFPQESRVSVKNTATNAVEYTREFPMSLHPRVVWTLGVLRAELPATKPTDLPWGQWIVRSIDPEKWRFGMRFVRVVEVLVPDDPQT